MSASRDDRADVRNARSALVGYLRQVEPIRLGVNRLLDTADPTLEAFGRHRISSAQAARRMDRLERRFAAYAVEVQEIQPRLPSLASLHQRYAQTYILEDAYLSALAAGVANGNLNGLPNTQAAQRAAIIAWRIGLTVLAQQTSAQLPGDIQQAGRGEIAPSPGAS